MKLDIVNANKETVGSLELQDEVFGGRVKTDLIWESVVQENASERRGTHMTKNRARSAARGKKPWRQKGTGRARVGEIRNPLWRQGGTVFGPQPRSYDYSLPKKVERGALRAALAAEARRRRADRRRRARCGRRQEDQGDRRDAQEARRRRARRWSSTSQLDEDFALTARNIAGVRLVPSSRVTARDVMDTDRVIATRAAVERLQEMLADEADRRHPPSADHREDDAAARSRAHARVRGRAGRDQDRHQARGREAVRHRRSSRCGPRSSHGKFKRQGRFVGQRSDWKKAYVRLREGEKIPEFLEGA